MRAGVCVLPGNYRDWDRFEAQERGENVPSRPVTPDDELVLDEIRMHERVEELGFDALWTVEHHFTPYTMITNPVQLLTYYAARTKRIDLGTMVIVLPWHNPIRVAEDITMLQMLMGNERRALIGFGRGLGRREFGGLRVEQDEARGRFSEGVELIRRALSEDRLTHKGEYFSTPELSLRPRAVRSAEALLGNLYGAWGSPSSIPTVAKTGLKPLIIPQRPWDGYVEDMALFDKVRAEAGYPPAKPIVLVVTYCAETEAEARQGAKKYIGEYLETAQRHYEIGGDHFAELKTYDYYATLAERMKAGTAPSRQGDQSSQLWGTPEMCIKGIERIKDLIDPSEIVFVFKHGSMPIDVAERNMDLVAKEVLPAVRAMSSKPKMAAVGA